MISAPYNVVTTSLFLMPDAQQYKDYSKYTNGVTETIKNVKEYLLSHNFVFRLYVDDSVTSREDIWEPIQRECKDAGFVEIIGFTAPRFRSPTGVGHVSTFGSLVRMMPAFRFKSSADTDVVSIRDLDIHHTPGQAYAEFYEFLSDTSKQALGYTNGYNPMHLRHIPKNHHGKVFGAGSVTFRVKFDPALFDGFLDDLLNEDSETHKELVLPTIKSSHRAGETAEGGAYYGVDELLLNHRMLPLVPAEAFTVVMFYDEPHYLVSRAHKRYIFYKDDASREEGRKAALRELRSKTDPSEKAAVVRTLMETHKDDIPEYEYRHNLGYDIARTYEAIML